MVEHFLSMCKSLALGASTVIIATKTGFSWLVPMTRHELASFPPSCVAGTSFKVTEEAKVITTCWSQTLGGREIC